MYLKVSISFLSNNCYIKNYYFCGIAYYDIRAFLWEKLELDCLVTKKRHYVVLCTVKILTVSGLCIAISDVILQTILLLHNSLRH